MSQFIRDGSGKLLGRIVENGNVVYARDAKDKARGTLAIPVWLVRAFGCVSICLCYEKLSHSAGSLDTFHNCRS